MRRGAAICSAPDPFVVREIDAYPKGGNRDTSSKAVRDPRLVAGEATGVFIIAGQSNACNMVDALYTPTHATKVDNVNIYDGGTYAAVDPLLGCHNIASVASVYGSIWGRMGDKLIAATAYDRVILVPIGIGATNMIDWRDAGPLRDRFGIALGRLAAVGLSATAIMWMQGEGDNVGGTSQANYESWLTTMISGVRAGGDTTPWLIGQCTYYNGTTSAAVRAAQAAVVNGTDIFAGADTDTLTGTSVNRQSDNSHLKAAGADAAAGLWRDAIVAAL